jgi:serine/threonine protein kinase
MRYLSHASTKSADLTTPHPPAAITDYQFSKLLGKGSYAQVRLATHRKSKATVAIKTYEKTKLADPLKRNSVEREIKALKALNHCNIIKFIDCFNDRL